MLFINFFKKIKINFFLNYFFLILIILACTLWQIKINNSRVIYWEPDDHLHFLNKSTTFKYCEDNNELCNHKNLISAEIISDKQKLYEYERQIHRLLLFYHPLYTFLLNLISNFFNIFDAQKIFHLIIGIIQAVIVFYYINYFSKNKLTSNLSVLLLSTHYYFGGWGIFYPNPWSISVLIASFTLTLNRRILIYSLMIISGLFHKVGLLVFLAVLFTKIIFFYLYINPRTIKHTINIFKIDLLITLFLFISIYLFNYSPFRDLNISILSVYNFTLSINYFVSLFLDNLKILFSGFKFLLLFSPMLLIFFIYSFIIKINNYKFLKLKIFSLLLILISVFYFLPSGGNSFALGTRLWHLISINFVILSVSALYFYNGKLSYFFKFIFICTLPFFIYLGFLLNYQLALVKNKTQNYYLMSEEVTQIVNQLPDNKRIFFDTSETNFYFFMANGLIKKNFYFASNFPFKTLDGIVVKNNPILNSYRNSSLILENDSNIQITSSEIDAEYLNIIIFSKEDTFININNSRFEIKEGINSILIKKNINYFFSEIFKPIYLIGLKINNEQKLYWPWGKNISMEIKNKEYRKVDIKDIASYYFKFPLFENYVYLGVSNFNFKMLPKFNDFCNNINIISDIGSTIIFENNCPELNNNIDNIF